MIVRIAPTAGGAAEEEACHVTMWTVTGPDAEFSEPIIDERVPTPQVRDLVTTSLPDAVEQVPIVHKDVVVEFVLPRRWLSWPVDEWTVYHGEEVLLGVTWPVVVRDLDWFDREDARELERRAHDLRDHAKDLAALMSWKDCAAQLAPPRGFHAWLRGRERPLALGLAGHWAQQDRIESAVAAGVPAVLWPRRSCGPDVAACGADLGDQPGEALCPGRMFRRDIVESLRDIRAERLPGWAHELRGQAEEADDPDTHCGAKISVLLDDPRRKLPYQLGFAS
ncbi:hypothetical protein ACFQ1L_14860 [Phytohabitans flavus]|uniref:VMAP-C domain-containing protein n=1 Tax=Phytohabitans flavus TaxID=1076124 RepID=UPI003627F149